MNPKTKRLLLAAIALAVLAGVFAGVWMLTRLAVSQGTKAITIEVIHKDGSKKSFTCRTDEEYLAGVLLAEDIAEGEEGQHGLYIKVVDGEEADFDTDGAYWAVYQGGEYATLGVSKLPVNNGDTFSLVYTVG